MICCNCLEKISHKVKKCPKCGAPVRLFVGGVPDTVEDKFRLRYAKDVKGKYNTEHYVGVLGDSLQKEWVTPLGDFSGLYRNHKNTTPNGGFYNYIIHQLNAVLIHNDNCVVSVSEPNGKYLVKIFTLANQWGEVNNDFIELDFEPEPGAIIFGDFYVSPVCVGNGRALKRKIAVINLKTLTFCGFLQDSNGDIIFGCAEDKVKLPKLLYDVDNRLLYVCAEGVIYVFIFTNSNYTPFKLMDSCNYKGGSAILCEAVVDRQNLFLLLYNHHLRKYFIVMASAVNIEKGLAFVMESKNLLEGKSFVKIFITDNKVNCISLFNRLENIEDGNLYLYTIDMTSPPDSISGMRKVDQTLLIQNSQFNCIDLMEIVGTKLIIYGHLEGFINVVRKVVFEKRGSGYILLSNSKIDNISDLPYFNIASRLGTISVPCPKHLSTNKISVYTNGRNLCLS